MVLDNCVKKGHEEVSKVEKQKDQGTCIYTDSIHKVLHPRLSFKVLVRAVVIHSLDGLRRNHKVDQRVNDEPRSIKLTRVNNHQLKVVFPCHLAKLCDLVKPLFVNLQASLVRYSSPSDPKCNDQWHGMDRKRCQKVNLVIN